MAMNQPPCGDTRSRPGDRRGGRTGGTWGLAAGFACALLLPLSGHATPIPLQKLVLTGLSIHIDSPALGSGDFPVASALPLDFNLGVFQDPILHLGGGPTDVRVFSSAISGFPAPSASADAATGTLAVDFRALRVATTVNSPFGPLFFSGPLVPLTTPPTADQYDPVTQAFSLTWDRSVPAVLGIPVGATMRVVMNGTAVPVHSVPDPSVPALLLVGALAGWGAWRRRYRLRGPASRV